MLNLLRAHWSKISAGLLLATVITAGGITAYKRLTTDDCCQPGSPCCSPGSPCCYHGAQR